MKKTQYSFELAGRTLSVELGKLAEQANGSAVVRYGDTTVLVTAVLGKKPREGVDYFPLMVDYEEKFYAAGKISGSRFIKREGRPSEEAVLSGRLIDRSIRPRFDHRMRNEVQVVATVLSYDGKNDPDVPALFGASLALSISDIPWSGPVAAIRVGKRNGEWLVNPSYAERKDADLDLIVSGLKEKINMVEAGAKEVSEEDLGRAFELAHQNIKKLIQFQEEILQDHARPKKTVPLSEASPELVSLFKGGFLGRVEEAMYGKGTKQEKYAARDAVEAEWKETAKKNFPEATPNTVDFVFHEGVNEIVHKRLLEKGERPDGRKHDELRKLSAEVAILPRVHGSGLFQRGETQILSVVTLGAPSDKQMLDTMEEDDTTRRFMHHYNFPPYSTGEVGRLGGGGRREIGHSYLAQRSMEPMIPAEMDFPYTIRLVSEALSSNGSTSMASVSASVLAMMDAGIPIKRPVAGIAMGLMMDEAGTNYTVLTDIQGPEDHHGDMDFKVAGSEVGVTGLQMDVKIEGVSVQILKDAMAQAANARREILAVMKEALAAPRPELSPTAPRILSLQINPEKIRDLIGPGGKMINEIIAKTGAQIDVEDDGRVFITALTPESGATALEWVKRVTKEIVPGELLEGRVTRLFDFGAMVEIAPKQEGLIHISELAPFRVDKVTDIVNIGDALTVKVKNIDDQGRINLSLKDVPDRYTEEEIASYKASHPNAGESRGGGRPSFRREDRDRRRRF